MSFVINPFVFAGSGYDPDAQAYITAVELEDGQALEVGVKDAINDFVVGCKSDGIWSAIKAACILAGARTLDGALVPLVGTAPTNANFVTGDYNRETGLGGNGLTKFLKTNRLNSDDPQNSKHLSVYRSESEDRAASRCAIGTSQATGASYLLTTTTLRYGRIHHSTGPALSDTTSTAGFWGTNRSISTACDQRYNGLNYTESVASSTPYNVMLTVFGRSGSLTPTSATQLSNARISFYSIGESLDLALLDSRVSTLMTALAAAIP
jgi:hypothetical protein